MEEDLRNYRSTDLTSNPGKVMHQIILGVISKHMTDREVTSQHKLTEQESYLNSLIAFHNKVMSSAGTVTSPALHYKGEMDELEQFQHRDIVESPSVETYKTKLNTVLNNLL
ncbi:hypothetical protein WISP_23911 [Willisornis vidua]|uniref:Uncharacterized protein n=1 Tax=Willisornis vidua TaxID=1566151 RepID=A0ABQ9DNP6_9PASS|nr:hypothetical protein WISP_23911 [Willisornis vidua]